MRVVKLTEEQTKNLRESEELKVKANEEYSRRMMTADSLQRTIIESNLTTEGYSLSQQLTTEFSDDLQYLIIKY